MFAVNPQVHLHEKESLEELKEKYADLEWMVPLVERLVSVNELADVMKHQGFRVPRAEIGLSSMISRLQRNAAFGL